MDKTLIDLIKYRRAVGLARSQDGETIVFSQHGVADLIDLLSSRPQFLRQASVADTVVGRGAALLMVKGGVAEVYAQIISNGALLVLRHAGISIEYGETTPYIRNRRGDGQCPVEKITSGTDNADEAFELIKTFLNSKKQ